MRHHRIRALVGRRFWLCATDSRQYLPVAPNLLAQRFSVPAPSRSWPAGNTYIATGEGWLYLASHLPSDVELNTRPVRMSSIWP